MTTTLLNRLQGAAQAAMPTRSPRVRAIARIRRETGCSSAAAHETMEMIEELVDQARSNPNFVAYLTPEQLHGIAYHIFELVIPHNQAARPGTAHAEIEAAVLRTDKDEFGLRHEQREETSGIYCTIRVSLGVVS